MALAAGVRLGLYEIRSKWHHRPASDVLFERRRIRVVITLF
jgi:hypothetical protein